jgi:hypothetical protein
MPDTTPNSVQLTRTGRQVRFLDLRIGEAFYCGGAFWTRTGTHAGTDLRQRARSLNEPATDTFGSCQFGVQEDSLFVEAVTLSFA